MASDVWIKIIGHLA